MKRLFTLALALILIIGMLPVPTYAAATEPMPGLRMYDPSYSSETNKAFFSKKLSPGQSYYVVFEDVTDDTGAVIGNKPVLTSAVPTDNFIMYYFNAATNVLEIIFQNINYQRTAYADFFIWIYKYSSSYTNKFDVRITLKGNNVISGSYISLMFENAGALTITGDGSLNVTTNYTSRAFLQKKNAGDFTLLNTTFNLTNEDTGTGNRGGIVVAGNIVIDGSTLYMNSRLSQLLCTGTDYNTMLTDTTKGITIKNGSDVDLLGRSAYTMSSKGFITIDNSDVYLNKLGKNDTPVFNIAPTITGSYSSRTGGRYALDRSYPGSFGLHPGDSVKTSHQINQFELIHKHYPTDCTTDSLCVCTKATVPASAEEHVLEHIEAQTATCTEGGWNAYDHCMNCAYTTKVEIPATGEHSMKQVEAQAATCGEIGWEAYEYCSSCDYTTIVEIPATGNHTVVQAEAKAPTCGEPGWEAHEYCTGCTSYTTKVEIPATGEHSIAQAEGKEPTCSEAGWDAYEYCKNCTYSTKVELPATGKLEVKPFYVLNVEAPWKDTPYVLVKPYFYTPTFAGKDTEFSVSAYGSTNIATMAARMKEDFDKRPAGTRYMNLNTMTKVLHGMVEHNVFYDVAVDAVKEWVEAFLAEYYRIGGKLDGIQVDVEYIYGGAWYITRAKNGTNSESRYNDPDIFWTIVNDERYATEIRPMLEALDFPFLAESSQTSVESEIYPIATKDSRAYKIWNIVNSYRMCAAVDEAVYEPLLKYYPNGRVTDYQVRYINGWQKTLNSTASPVMGNRVGIGSTSNFNLYNARPDNSISGYGDSAAYSTPPSYNNALYELTPFNHVLWETNIFKNMYDATPSKRIAVHVAFFNYYRTKIGGYANTPYYAESIFHIGLMDPEPFMGYIREVEVFEAGASFSDPNMSDYGYHLTVLNDIAKELSRVAGASDRKPIAVPAYWNSKFLISGMYAGGRNIWRITPETATGVSLEDFKVKDQAPTFYINGQTVIFPQGRIIEDGYVRQVGTCGYWVETPAGVEPIIINDTDRYSEYPALEENFEGYTAGSEFNSSNVLPKGCWEVAGSAASVQLHNGSNALAMTGTSTINHVKLPKNITAGDSYAKQQVWEVKVTIPTSGTLKVLSGASGDAGITISNGAVSYANGSSMSTLSGVTLSAGETYIIRRELDFTSSSYTKSSYTVYDANGTKLGGVSNVTVHSVVKQATQVMFSTTGVSGTAYIDDLKMYPTGVTTELEAYDVETGFELDDPTATRTEDTAYRLSWMNASSEYKVAKVYNNGVVVEEIPMAPGADGVATGVVTGTSIALSVATESGTSPTIGDYDSGDFAWTAVAEALGLASGNSKGNFEANLGTSIIVHDLVPVEGKETSCTEEGWNSYEYCTKCDYTTYVEKEALGHDKITHEAKAPTCTEVGWDAYETCTRCDYTTYVELPALGHDVVYHDGKIPTYTETGWDAYETCTRCDYTTYKAISTVEPKIQVTWPGKFIQKGLDEVNVNYYIEWVDGVPTLVYEKPTGSYINFLYVSDGDSKPVLNVTFKDVNHVTTGANNSQFLRIYNNNGHSSAFDVVVNLVGDNLLDGFKSGIYLYNNGDLTVTGNGSLTINSIEASTKAFSKEGNGSVYIKDTTLNVNLMTGSSGLVYGIHVANDLTIEGSEVNVHAASGSVPVYSKQGVITIKNSDFVGEQTSGIKPVIYSPNPVVFNNSNVTLIKTVNNHGHCLNLAPQIVGTYSGQWYSTSNTGAASTLKDYTTLNYKPGETWSGGTNKSNSFNYFKLEHTCEAQPDDGDCSTPVKCIYCGRELVAANEHILDEYIEDEMADSYVSVTYCTVCGKEISRTTVCKHTIKAVINEKLPTCVETGYSGDTACGICGEILEAGEVILVTGHTPGIEAACENPQICTVCGEQLVPATGHTYKTETTAPTCTEAGKTVYTCACGDTYEEVVPSTGHTPGTDSGTCSVCGEKIVPAEVKVTFYVAKSTKFYKTVATGETTYVVAVDKLITDWTGTEAPTDNYMKLEYIDGTLKVTFKNFNADMTAAGGYTCHGIKFPAGKYAVAMELIGENSLTHGNSSSIKCDNAGGLTITGSGSLALTQSGYGAAALWMNGCDLTIKDTAMFFNVNPGTPYAKYHAILATTEGNVTIEGSTITSQTQGGQLVYFGEPSDDDKMGRYTLDADTDRIITIKNSEITSTSYGKALESTSPAVISNTTFTATVTDSGPIFSPAPTLEGEYTAIAGLAKNADNLEKLYEYTPKKLSSYTYIKIVPGCYHDFYAEVVPGYAPVCPNAGLTDGKKCSNCGITLVEQEIIPVTGHSFNQENVDDKYLKSAATLNAKAVYYYSCACGESSHGYAEEATFEYGNKLTGATAMAGDLYYGTLEEAIAAGIENGTVVKLQKAVNTGNALVVTGNVTIDFGGYAYTASKIAAGQTYAPIITIAEGATVTLKNGKIQVRAASKTLFNYVVENNGTLITENITLNGTNTYADAETATIKNNGTLTLGESTVVTVKDTGLLTTTDTVTKAASVELAAAAGCHWVDGTDLEFHVFDQEVAAKLYRKSAATTTATGVYYKSCTCGESSVGYAEEATFNFGDLVPAKAVARVGENSYYSTIEAAITAAVANGEDIELLKAINTANAFVINGDVTIDFCGLAYTVSKTINGEAVTPAVQIAEGATVTLKNGTLRIRYADRSKFNYLIENNGTLTTEDIILNGTNLYAADNSAIKNNGTLSLGVGTMVNVSFDGYGLKTTSTDVVKDRSVEVLGVADYHWVSGATLTAHVFDKEAVVIQHRKSAPNMNSPAIYYTSCACGVNSKGTAFEATFTYGEKASNATAEAEIDGYYYRYFADALTAAIENGGTVKMLKDLNTAKPLTLNSDVTIDFNGFTYTVNEPITGTQGYAVAVTIGEDANVNFLNGRLQIRYNRRHLFNYLIENNGTLTAQNIVLRGQNVYKAGSSDYTAAILNTGMVELKAGTIVEIRVNAVNTTNANVTKDATIAMKPAKGYHWSDDQTVLVPHVFDQEIFASHYRKSAATINSPAIFYKTCSCGVNAKGLDENATFEYGERLGGAAAKTGNTYYATIEEAIAVAIESGETVEVQMAIKNAKALEISGDVTIDFGGYLYTVNTTISDEIGAVITIADGANVTLKNGTVQVASAAGKYFDALIENNGELYVENIALKGANISTAGAVLVKGNAMTEGEGVTKVDPAN